MPTYLLLTSTVLTSICLRWNNAEQLNCVPFQKKMSYQYHYHYPISLLSGLLPTVILTFTIVASIINKTLHVHTIDKSSLTFQQNTIFHSKNCALTSCKGYGIEYIEPRSNVHFRADPIQDACKYVALALTHIYDYLVLLIYLINNMPGYYQESTILWH